MTTPVAQEVKAAEYDAFLSCMAFSPDGQHIVSGSVDYTLRLLAGARRRGQICCATSSLAI